MKIFISKTVDQEGIDLFFGYDPNYEFIEIQEDWKLNDILKEIGIPAREKDLDIPRGFSQFQSKDGDFEKSIFILNL